MPTKLLQGSYGLSNTKLEGCNAQPGDVIAGRTFYAGDDNKKTGTLQEQQAYTNSVSTAYNASYLYARIPYGAYRTKATVGYPEIMVPINDVINAVPGGNRGAWGTTINPGGSVTIPQGYHNGGGVVWANGSYRTPWEHTVATGYTYDLSKFSSVPNHPEVKVRVDASSYLWLTVDSGVIHISHNVAGCIWVDGYQYYFAHEGNSWNGDVPLNG